MSYPLQKIADIEETHISSLKTKVFSDASRRPPWQAPGSPGISE